MRRLRGVLFILLLCGYAAAAWSQLSEAQKAAVVLGHDYAVRPDITYQVANNHEAKLDVLYPLHPPSAVPVLMLIHGGGWVAGRKERNVLETVPYLEMGFAVVNVEYRLANVSLAPAAVEDCLCALHWIGRHAEEYKFDLNRIVVTGNSAGGHLALTTGMIPASAGLENECAFDDDPNWNGGFPGPRPKVAAVINRFGITDVADLLQGPNMRGYAVNWLGGLPNRDEVARRVSPLTYVRPGLPPILTIHGDADKVVPYSHAVRLHEALTKAGVHNQLFTISGGGHGGFTAEQELKAFEAVRAFLESAGITRALK